MLTRNEPSRLHYCSIAEHDVCKSQHGDECRTDSFGEVMLPGLCHFVVCYLSHMFASRRKQEQLLLVTKKMMPMMTMRLLTHHRSLSELQGPR